MLGSNLNKIKLGIINLKLNNLFSIYQACHNIGYKTEIIDHKVKKYNHDILILPGVGSFNSAMSYLNKNGIRNRILEFVHKKNKILFSVCLGMQLLFEESAEFGSTKGLGLIKGKVKKLKKQKNIKIPHIGWANIRINSNKKNFINKRFNKRKYYFIHSYYCLPRYENEVCSFTSFGKTEFCSAVRKNNILGTQFHPEKSGALGLKMLSDLKKLL